jgi:hypothetical protein
MTPAERVAAIRKRAHPGHAITIARTLPDGEIRDGTCVVTNGKWVKDSVRQVWLHDLPWLLGEVDRLAQVEDSLDQANLGTDNLKAEFAQALDRLAAVEAERDRALGQAATLVAEFGEPSDRLAKLEAAAAFAAQLVWNAPVGGTHDPDWEQRARDHLGKLERLLPGCLDRPVDLAVLDEAGAS